jgi:uncharacterized protein (UPF0548 family)
MKIQAFPFVVPFGYTERDGDRLLEAMKRAEVTYAEVGATNGELPNAATGYKSSRHVKTIGRGPADFDRAVEGIRTWQAHRAAKVSPRSSAPIEVGATAMFVVKLFPMEIRICCRIVSVVDEPNRFGFSYGTLPCHPEVGEEQFLVERNPDTNDVTFRINVFWKSVSPLLRLGSPITKAMQRNYTERYLNGLAAFVVAEGGRAKNRND